MSTMSGFQNWDQTPEKTWVQKTVLKVDFRFFHSDFKVQDLVLKHDFGFSNLRVQIVLKSKNAQENF